MNTSQLEDIRREARRLVDKEGLNPYPVEFGIVNKSQMNELSAYGGLPERYPHWRFGMRYDRQKKQSSYGGLRMYELVINSNPALAYLQEENSLLQNKAIMVHVYAHSDFFRNNQWFEHTRDDMEKVIAKHADTIQKYMDHYGIAEVESFLDKVLSLEYCIDPHAPFISEQAREEATQAVEKIPVQREYMDRFINPEEWVVPRRDESVNEKREKEREEPTKDLLQFLSAYGRLKEWQREVIAIVREESYYFAPQMMTKIMNEGWAAYWQSKIMAERGFAEEEEIVDHADMQSKVLGGSSGFNPYSLGKRIWEDIKFRWDRGRYGRQWENCEDRKRLDSWDTGEKAGKKKMFEVRENLNDVMFLDSFFRRKLFEDMDLFSYEWIPEVKRYHLTSRDFKSVRKKLLFRFTHLGRPTIRVETGNYENRGELLLIHEFNGVNLHLGDAKKVLRNLYDLWGRPVNLKTVVRDREGSVVPMNPETRLGQHSSGPPSKIDQPVQFRFSGDQMEKEELPQEELEKLVYDDTDYDTLPRPWIGR